MTRAAARNAAVLIAGLAVLGVVLFNATNVDAQPPRVASYALTHHLAASDEVALTNSSIEVTFSETVDKASAERAFRVAPELDGTFSWAGTTMSFSPSGGLPIDGAFTVTVAAGVRDAAGNESEASAAPFAFRTVARPAVTASDPLPGGEVAASSPVTLTFSTLMDTASVERALRVAPHFDYYLRWSGETVTVVPSEPLDAGTDYELIVDRRATDLAGNRMLRPFVLHFLSAADVLERAWLVPSDRLAGASPWTAIAVGFDQALDPETVDDAFTIEPDVPGSLALIQQPLAGQRAEPSRASVLRFLPSSPLPANTTFTVEVASGIRAADGRQLDQPLSWSFTTGAPFPSLENQIVFLTERGGIRNLWAMNPDGSNQRQLSAELSSVVAYDVSPDARRFVVGDGERLVEYAADGGARRMLTDDGVLEFDPAYRPDGEELVFGRADAQTGAGLGLWTREPGGGTSRPVEIASQSPPPGTASPGAQATAAASQAPLAADPVLRAPRYSPDGALLAYVEARAAAVVLEIDTGSVTRVPFVVVGAPSWRPDSSEAVFAGAPPHRAGRASDNEAIAGTGPQDELPPDVSVGDLRLVRVAFRDERARETGLRGGAFAPIVASSGRLAFLRGDARVDRLAGSVWTAWSASPGVRRLADPDTFLATSVSFGPNPTTLVAARVGTTSSGDVHADGIWTLPTEAGLPDGLSPDGDTPDWVP
ncbi:MAG: Ig-like domain-containing protein [Candidatus Limnocylindria bacterium]